MTRTERELLVLLAEQLSEEDTPRAKVIKALRTLVEIEAASARWVPVKEHITLENTFPRFADVYHLVRTTYGQAVWNKMSPGDKLVVIGQRMRADLGG